MAKFEYACFISYKHPPRPRHLWFEFVQKFQEELAFFLSTELPIYWDNNLNSRAGVKYPQELSEKLCKSVCMVVVLVQEYQESNWCRAEWKAMEELEEKRLGRNHKQGLIIPVLLKGDKTQAQEFAKHRQIVELQVLRPKVLKTSKKYSKVINDIAEQIDKLVRDLDDKCDDCSDFKIPVEKEVLSSQDLNEPDPTRWSN